MVQKIESKEIDPLGVLLSLLEKKQLEISNFSLAQVADQYLHYLDDFKDQNKILENISEFLWVASKLALLKSKLLLESFQIEEIAKDEDGEELRNRLIEYQKFREISSEVRVYLEGSRELLIRKNREFVGEDFKIQFSGKDLEIIFKQVINNFNLDLDSKLLRQEKELVDVIKIKEKIEQIKNILNKVGTIKFSKIVFDETNRLEVVVSFLAILELVKQGVINIEQKKSFQDIEISY